MARHFDGAERREIRTVLDSLASLGIAVRIETEEGFRWQAVRREIA